MGDAVPSALREIGDAARRRADGPIDTFDLLAGLRTVEPGVWVRAAAVCGLEHDLRRPADVVEEEGAEAWASGPALLVLQVADDLLDVVGGQHAAEALLLTMSLAVGCTAQRCLAAGAHRPTPRRLWPALLAAPPPSGARRRVRLVVDRPRGDGRRIVRARTTASGWTGRAWWERAAVGATLATVALVAVGVAQVAETWSERAMLRAASERLEQGEAERAHASYRDLLVGHPRSRPATAGYLCSLDTLGRHDEAYAYAQRIDVADQATFDLRADPACAATIERLTERPMIAERYGAAEMTVYWWDDGDLSEDLRDLLSDTAVAARDAYAAAACANHRAGFRQLPATQLTWSLALPAEAPLPSEVDRCLDAIGDHYRIERPGGGPRLVYAVDPDPTAGPLGTQP